MSRLVALAGASGGVGRATAREFARRGARLAQLARGETGRPSTMTSAMPDAVRLSRASGVAGALWGAVLLAAGRRVWLAVDGRPPTDVDEVAIRVLGVRHVAQGLFQAVSPLRLDPLFVAVDLVHAATMVPLVLADDRRRRPAIVTASAALVTAGLTVAARRRRR